MTILCGTDFTESAAEALSVAAALAAKRGEALLLAHVVQPQPADPVELFTEDLRKTYESQLNTDADALREKGITVGTKVVFGAPDLELIASAPEDTTLIVVGAGRHRAGTHWLIGSTAERLARCSPHPLLVVRDAAGLKQWLAGGRRLEVMAATDLSPASDYAFERAVLLKDFGPCQVELTYVDYPPAEYPRLGVSGPLYRRHEHPVVERVLTNELKKRAAAVDFGEPVRTHGVITTRGVGATLAEAAQHERADLIVVGTHQRKGWASAWQGSVAHDVLHHAATNVLCIPFHSVDEDARSLIGPHIDTIVAATDLTPAGNHAIAWAMSIARPGACVVVTTVATGDEDVQKAATTLAEIAPPDSWPKGITLTMEVVDASDVASNVCAVAERVGADLIVLGRRGPIANDIAASTQRSVLIARDEAA
jgi:nucleotide-binding universal stress UspA family protein